MSAYFYKADGRVQRWIRGKFRTIGRISKKTFAPSRGVKLTGMDLWVVRDHIRRA